MSNSDDVAELNVIKREHVMMAIQETERVALSAGERFSVVYHGKRFDPKALLASAYLFSTGSAANNDEWQVLSYNHFVEKLESLGFRVVKYPETLGDTQLPVMVYEVKKPPIVQSNYQRLFSSDRSRFYWNNDKFLKLNLGDIVFIVNASAKQVFYALVEQMHITTQYDKEKDITHFSHSGESYEVTGKWNEFVCLRLRDIQKVSDHWQWKTLGSGEHTYLSGPLISEASAENNIQRINLLMEVFASQSEAELRLQVCYQALTKLLANKSDQPSTETEPTIWYVMQGRTFNDEQGKRYLWAPLKNEKGRTFAHWTSVGDIKLGDVIVHHADGSIRGISRAVSIPYLAPNPFPDVSWKGEGNKVDVKLLIEFQPAIGIETIRKLQVPLSNALAELRGPYNANGSGNQGYLFEFSWEALAIILNNNSNSLPAELKRWLPTIEPDIEELESGLPINSLPTKHTEIESYVWLPKVQQFMAAKGFDFTLADIANFYLSLRTKPLVMLAGTSGTGKTQMVRQFAKAIGYGDERHCVLIPVRPDWADNTDLLGYRNIQGQFEQQKLLKVLQDALAHPDDPFFVILDEMNLARVEHYFSDFLSVLETRERNADDMIITSPVVTDSTVNRGVPVGIPQNLMIVGTVNMDETTHPFSRKVLDRANAIEMNQINLPWGESISTDVDSVAGIYADAFVVPYLNSIELSVDQKQALQPVITLLVNINQILEPAGLHFGYRVRDEVSFYLTQFNEQQLSSYEIMTMDDALDYQIMQKVLPRIQGSSIAVITALLMLLKELTGVNITKDMEYTSVEKIIGDITEPLKYPRSVKKLLFMQRRFNEDGFTSFWL